MQTVKRDWFLSPCKPLGDWNLSLVTSLDSPETLIKEFRRWIVANRNLPQELRSYSYSDIWYKYNDFYGSFSDFMENHNLKDEEISVPEYLGYINSYQMSEG